MMHIPKPQIIRPNAGFIIPTRRFVDVGMPLSRVSAKGRYQLIVRDAWGIEKRRTPWFDNIILDSGLNRWGTGNIISGAAIGTGTSPPAASDTGLQTQTHYTTTTGTGHSSIASAGTSPNYNNTRTSVYRTTLGALNGNYYEVGVGWASGSMFSRALILDGGGSPTFVSVASTEQLDIVYQLSVYPPLVDTGPSVVTISGVDYTVTGRASSVTTANGVWGVSNNAGDFQHVYSSALGGSLGAITGTPSSGTGSGSFGGSWTDAYVNNSNTKTGGLTAGLTNANVPTGILSVNAQCLFNFAAFQYEFSPRIPKDGTKTLALNFSISWARRP